MAVCGTEREGNMAPANTGMLVGDAENEYNIYPRYSLYEVDSCSGHNFMHAAAKPR